MAGNLKPPAEAIPSFRRALECATDGFDRNRIAQTLHSLGAQVTASEQ